VIVVRAPFRVSFFGGGTDYPVWFHEQPGAVLATTIDKYCYISVRPLPPFFEHRSRIVWSQIESVYDHAEIRHPVVREALAFLGITDGIELHHQGDLPARTGIGSSSTFTVAVLHALYALRGEMVSKVRLARDAIHLEQQRLKEHVGSQDQVLAAFGGFNRVDFTMDGAFQVTPLVMRPEKMAALERCLMLFFTGFSRNASEIAKAQVDLTAYRGSELKRIYEMVEEAIALLNGTVSLDEIGRLLDEGWRIKRSLTPIISTPQIDEIYAAARAAGALGGKLLGAGGGGFMLLFVRPEQHAAVRARLTPLLEVPFAFERAGSEIVFYEPGTVRS
jgi:D-glycero-alpha-D-manno-heptose-7-phosphate kinase